MAVPYINTDSDLVIFVPSDDPATNGNRLSSDTILATKVGFLVLNLFVPTNEIELKRSIDDVTKFAPVEIRRIRDPQNKWIKTDVAIEWW